MQQQSKRLFSNKVFLCSLQPFAELQATALHSSNSTHCHAPERDRNAGREILAALQMVQLQQSNPRLAHHGLQCKEKGLPLSHLQKLHAKCCGFCHANSDVYAADVSIDNWAAVSVVVCLLYALCLAIDLPSMLDRISDPFG